MDRPIEWLRWEALSTQRNFLTQNAAQKSRNNERVDTMQVIAHTGELVQDYHADSFGDQPSESSTDEDSDHDSDVDFSSRNASGAVESRGLLLKHEPLARANQTKPDRLKLRALEFLANISINPNLRNDRAVSGRAGDNVDKYPSSDLLDLYNKSGLASEVSKTSQSIQTQGISDDMVSGRGLYDVGNNAVEKTGIRLTGNTKYHYISMHPSAHSLSTQGSSGKSHTAPKIVSRADYNRRIAASASSGESRTFISLDKGYPLATFSVIKYIGSVETSRRKGHLLAPIKIDFPRRRPRGFSILPANALESSKRLGTSYANYFDKTWASAMAGSLEMVIADIDDGFDRNYDPKKLDDRGIRQGKRCMVQSLDGFLVSILPYTKKKELKAKINDIFREQHPNLPAELSLSKIRNLKAEVLQHVLRIGLEISTAALAVVYFEKLVFKGVVNKGNRKLVISVCLVLAFKFNEPKQDEKMLQKLFEDIERVQSLSRREVLSSEFSVFGHLLFRLKPADNDVMVHFYRYLKQIEMTPSEYLGEDQAQHFFQIIDCDE